MKDYKNIFFIVLTVLSIWVVYYFTIRVPQIREQELKDSRALVWLREQNLNECYRQADALYTEWWNDLCRKLGRSNDCLLNNQQADNLHSALVSRRINCQNLYK